MPAPRSVGPCDLRCRAQAGRCGQARDRCAETWCVATSLLLNAPVGLGCDEGFSTTRRLARGVRTPWHWEAREDTMHTEDAELDSHPIASPVFQITRRRAVARPPLPGQLLLYQASLLSLVVGLLAFALVRYAGPPPSEAEIGRLDVSWDSCRHRLCTCEEQGVPRPPNWPELDLHAEGYTIRSRVLDIAIPRRSGKLDLALLGDAFAALKLNFDRYPTLDLYVESGVPHGEVVRTMDLLESVGTRAKLQLFEPPGSGICLQRGGCVPVDGDPWRMRLRQFILRLSASDAEP